MGSRGRCLIVELLRLRTFLHSKIKRGLRTIRSTGSGSVHNIYDVNGNLLLEADSAGTVLNEYVYLNGVPLALLNQTITTKKVKGKPVTTITDHTYYYISDHLNTAQLLVNEQGTVAWRGNYTPFGGVDIVVNTVKNNFRFPGQYFDAETGLYYNWHRFYDPETGRYISADPIGLQGGLNLYAYVHNDPVNWIDPLGLDEHWDELCSDSCCECSKPEYVSVSKTISSKYMSEYFYSVIEDAQLKQAAALAKFLYKVRKNPIGNKKKLPIPPKPHNVIIGISRRNDLVQPMKCWREVCLNTGDVYYNGCDFDGDSQWIINMSAPTKDIEKTYFW